MYILSLLLLVAATQPDDAAAAKPDVEKSERVCKTVKETGSRLGGKRECRSKEEWTRIEEENQRKAHSNMGQ